MKKLTIILLVMFVYNISNAQQQQEEDIKTLFGGGIKYTGWFIGIPVSFSEIENRMATMSGIEAGVSFNRKLNIGLRSYSLNQFYNRLEYADKFSEKCYMECNYGGILFEPVFNQEKSIHFTIPVFVGGGNISYISESKYQKAQANGEYDYKNLTLDHSSFFAFEPGIKAEVNLFKHISISAGISYRLTSELDLQKSENDILNGVSGNVTLKFGKF